MTRADKIAKQRKKLERRVDNHADVLVIIDSNIAMLQELHEVNLGIKHVKDLLEILLGKIVDPQTKYVVPVSGNTNNDETSIFIPSDKATPAWFANGEEVMETPNEL